MVTSFTAFQNKRQKKTAVLLKILRPNHIEGILLLDTYSIKEILIKAPYYPLNESSFTIRYILILDY
jgi:hypothetical protein